jgi:hypothetical protein
MDVVKNVSDLVTSQSEEINKYIPTPAEIRWGNELMDDQYMDIHEDSILYDEYDIARKIREAPARIKRREERNKKEHQDMLDKIAEKERIIKLLQDRDQKDDNAFSAEYLLTSAGRQNSDAYYEDKYEEYMKEHPPAITQPTIAPPAIIQVTDPHPEPMYWEPDIVVDSTATKVVVRELTAEEQKVLDEEYYKGFLLKHEQYKHEVDQLRRRIDQTRKRTVNINSDISKIFRDVGSESYRFARLIEEGIDEKLVSFIKDNIEHLKIKALIDVKEFNTQQSTLSISDVPIYIKAAGSVCIYDQQNMIEGHAKILADMNNPEAFEFVGFNRIQKIMIVAKMPFIQAEIDVLKTYLTHFIQSKYPAVHTDFSKEDLIVRYGSDRVELLIDKWYVKNAECRIIFVNNLISYIRLVHDNNQLADKLSTGFDGTTSIKYLDGQLFKLAGNLHFDEHQLHLKNRNISIPQILTNLGMLVDRGRDLNRSMEEALKIRSTEATHQTIISNPHASNSLHTTDQHCIEFLAAIRTKAPSWYKPGKYVSCQTIYDYFCKNYTTNLSITKFSSQMKDRLYHGKPKPPRRRDVDGVLVTHWHLI